MTREQVLKRIRSKIADCESQTRAADYYGISAQHLNDVIQGKRAPRGKILEKLGLEVDEVYRQKKVSA